MRLILDTEQRDGQVMVKCDQGSCSWTGWTIGKLVSKR